jgi:hypothetical protein
MRSFLDKHSEKITATLSCFDRILFKGHLPLGWDGAMEGFLAQQGLKIKDFKRFVPKQAERLKEHARNMAEKLGRPYIHLNGTVRKEELARDIARRDDISEGLVCILAAVEACHSFKIAYGDGRPKIERARRKCLCLYYYFLDREFGFLHLRIQTWFPFMVQVCLNGHDWLGRKLAKHGVAFRQVENAFHSIEDPRRAQRFADRFVSKNWPRILSAFARRINPLLKTLLRDMDYYWVTDQAEYATDLLFRNRTSLKDLYEKLVKHATHCFSAEDVLTFLGKKLNGNFKGEILNDYKKRWPGARVKHRMKENWIKMYDKHGCVLRIETVINHPYDFKVRRWGTREGRQVLDWYPMAKGVGNLYRYAEVSLTANRRYLEALAEVEDTADARLELRRLARPLRRNGRPYRGFNPAAEEDALVFEALLRGEHAIMGFRNRDIRSRLFRATKDPGESRRQSARISRLLKRLHVHRLVAKIPRSRRWRVTRKGHNLMAAAVRFHHETYPQALKEEAA